VRSGFSTEVFAEFWKRYHVDFDRVILDGADGALALAATQPIFFAGIVLRGGKIDPDLVKNYGSIPVYVFDEAIEKALKDAGHTKVTRGASGGLAAWMNERKRETPTTFSWRMKAPDQVLANWVSIERADPMATERSLKVAVDREKNRIQIDATAIEELRLFLNDQIVDLDKEIQLVVNGHEEKKFKVTRDLDMMLDQEPIKIRKSLYLGWLFPARRDKVRVKAAASPETGATPTPPDKKDASATAEPAEPDALTEAEAESFFRKAGDAETAGNLARAMEYYKKIIALGASSFREKAEAKVKELAGKIESPVGSGAGK
jgi:hypothetical protein